MRVGLGAGQNAHVGVADLRVVGPDGLEHHPDLIWPQDVLDVQVEWLRVDDEALEKPAADALEPLLVSLCRHVPGHRLLGLGKRFLRGLVLLLDFPLGDGVQESLPVHKVLLRLDDDDLFVAHVPRRVVDEQGVLPRRAEAAVKEVARQLRQVRLDRRADQLGLVEADDRLQDLERLLVEVLEAKLVLGN